MTQSVANILGSRATTKLNDAENILLRQSGANRMAVTALTRDGGKKIRVSDHPGNRYIEKAPLVGVFLCPLRAYQGVPTLTIAHVSFARLLADLAGHAIDQ
jgi:hypothetical protein